MSDQGNPWCQWPEVFNAGTCEENEAWSAMRSAEDFFKTSPAFSAYFRRMFVPSFRRREGGFEFLLPDADSGAGRSILRVWVGEKGCDKVEVRRG